jgi:hypothetical protein
MKRTIITSTLIMMAFSSFGQWTTITTDSSSDAPTGMEGSILEWQYDVVNDDIQFRITCPNLATYANSPSADFSFALPNGTDSGTPSGTHWSSTTPVNKTAEIYTDAGGTPPAQYTYATWGGLYIYEPAGLPTADLCVGTSCVGLNVDVANNQMTYTFDRSGIITDTEMGGSNTAVIGLVMNVGNNVSWSDAITHNSGGASTATFTLTLNGGGNAAINELANDAMTVYPNPASTIIQLQNNKTIHNASIVSLTGEEVLSVSSNQALTSINIESLEKGMYIINYIDEDKALIQQVRFIKL